MRHRVVKKTLGRNTNQRKALLSILSSQLIENGKINTTLPKAKVIKPRVEKLITKAVRAVKSNDKIVKFNTVKLLKKSLRSDEVIRKLMVDIAPKYVERPGGYTKIIKTGNRDGDNSLTARIELVTSSEDVKAKIKGKSKKDENKTK